MTTLSTFTSSPHEIIRTRVDSLERNWVRRRQMVTRWYKMIQLKNDLAQEGMESVIGNDPRSSYNLATWLLTPKTWTVTAFKEGLSEEQFQAVTAFEQIVQREVVLSIRSSRGRLNGSYLSQAVKLFVATGWISLIAAPTQPRWTINAWHPLTVFPGYGSDGQMVEVGRKYTLSATDANALIFREGWIPPNTPFRSSPLIRQYWAEIPEGVFMAVMMDGHMAQPLAKTIFDNMPIYCQPAGGLPDDGTIVNDEWRADIGQSIVASVMDLQKNYDRMLTYMQQLLRDTANPKWIERSDGDGVVKPEDITKRGAVWNIGLGADIWAVQPPGAPVDLRTHEFDLRNQIQRGTFQDTSFGGGDVSAFLMANTTSSTKQILQPFLDVMKDGNGVIFTNTAALARKLGMDIGGSTVENLPDDISLDFKYDIEVPGDFLQRSNSARILNPNFRISQETIMELQFPEVKSPFEESLRLTTEDVMNSQIMVTIKTIRELRQAAFQANRAGDGESESLLMQAADQQQAQLVGPAPQQGPGGQASTFRDMIEAGS